MDSAEIPNGIERLKSIMVQLRDPHGGCPWDQEQSFKTVAPLTIEEAYEVTDAIDREDMPGLMDELGDLLFQVVFHAQLASESGAVDFEDVVTAISDKMVRRHPHVFGDVGKQSPAQLTIALEEQKAREREANSVVNSNGGGPLKGVARGLPALLRAYNLQNRAARVGFDWLEVAEALEALREELNELAKGMVGAEADQESLKDELGEVLFGSVILARKLGVDPEAALRRNNDKFEDRFGFIERRLMDTNKKFSTTPLAELNSMCQLAKQAR